MAQHRLDISELDFENIKGSLKDFFQIKTNLKITILKVVQWQYY